jgi:hypothetical protein
MGYLQYNKENRPVQLAESMAFQRQFLDPVVAAASCLGGKGGELFAIADGLVRAASAVLPT